MQHMTLLLTRNVLGRYLMLAPLTHVLAGNTEKREYFMGFTLIKVNNSFLIRLTD